MVAILAKPRRSFRFSLRTLFVVVTVFACWLGYQLNWIRERHAYLSKADAFFAGAPLAPSRFRWNVTMADDPDLQRWSASVGLPARAPWSLRIFGEPAVAMIDVTDEEFAQDWVKRGRRLFPEAAFFFLGESYPSGQLP
jgi:hypothetical protein